MAMSRTTIALPPAMAAEMATERANRLQKAVETWLAANVPTQLRQIGIGQSSVSVTLKPNEIQDVVITLDRTFPDKTFAPFANLADSSGGVVSIREVRVDTEKSIRVVLQAGPGAVSNKAVTVVAAGIGGIR